jgi:hypothetical protein
VKFWVNATERLFLFSYKPNLEVKIYRESALLFEKSFDMNLPTIGIELQPFRNYSNFNLMPCFVGLHI